MLPNVSVGLTMARVVRRLSIPEVAIMAGVSMDDVFDAENFLDEVDPISVQLIALALNVDLTKLIDTI